MDSSSIIDSYKNEMLSEINRVISIPAIPPAFGGKGETERANYLESLLKNLGFVVKRYDYKDGTGAARPNLITSYGTAQRTIWLVAHIDTAAEGDLSQWKYKPFKVTIENGKMYGRGTNDNGQDIIAAIYAIRALKESGVKPKYNMGIALVSDEELGSIYGICKLLEENIFKKDDMFMIPAWGSKDGDVIDTAEKGVAWIKIIVEGKQTQTSHPENGVNALRYAVEFLSAADKLLHEKYNSNSSIFSPPYSTFEMTKHEKGTSNVNTVPGEEVFYMDCRLLPEYNIDEVLADLQRIADMPRFKNVKIKIETYLRMDSSPATDPNSEVVKLTQNAIKKVMGLEPKVSGIGSVTTATFFRSKGYNVAVWSKLEDLARIPNESANIDDMITDAKVFAKLFE
ncbi:MAG: M20 family metallo-hydrolase [Candidatus Marsarchaeota archaeon]|nr:M20 family metallo-hydrolase [Candidatus Marsarchaeota archaeon]